MSFSFNARAATKALVLAAVAAEMAKVVEAQPVHKHDAEAVQAAAETYVGLIPEPTDKQDVIVAASGWLEWQDSSENEPAFVGASVSVSARLIAKE